MVNYVRNLGVITLMSLLLLISFPYVYSIWYPATNKYRPLIGGIKFTPVKFYILTENYVPKSPCTLGYIAKSLKGDIGVVTASHCFEWTLMGENWWWEAHQPTYLSSGSNFVGEVTILHPYVDAAFIYSSEVSPKILTKLPSGTTYTSKVVYFYKISEIEGGALNNVIIKHTGYASGVSEGSFMGYMPVYMLGNRMLEYIVLSDYTSQNGDSGGTVYELKTVFNRGKRSFVINLIGIHVAREFWTISVASHGIQLKTGLRPVLWGEI